MPLSSWLQRHSRVALLLSLAALLMFYQVIFLHYRPYDIDNPWFLSFSYNRHIRHIQSDDFLRVRFPSGMDGTQFFGSIAAECQATVAMLFGWQQRPMTVLSSVAVISSLGLWAWSLRRLGYAFQLVLTFLIAAGTAEPYISAANRFRFEPLSILLISAGLLLSTFDLMFMGIFVAAIAIETQPSALLGLLPILIFNVTKHGLSRTLIIRAAAALALAAAATLLLHPQLWRFIRLGESSPEMAPLHVVAADHSGFISYFLILRHLPETLLLAVSPWVFLFRGRRLPKSAAWIAWSALAAAGVAIMSPHPNVIYTIFFYPFLLLLALLWFSDRQLAWIAVACVANAAVQSAYLSHLNHGQGYRADDLAQVSQVITQGEQTIGMTDANVHLFGDYSVWYAHPNNFLAAGESTASAASSADILLCYKQRPPGVSQPRSMIDCDDMLKLVPAARPLGATNIRGNTLWLYTPHFVPN